MTDEKEKYFPLPLDIHVVPSAHSLPIDSPEKIVQDLMETEKQITAETLRLIRSRHDHEKTQWEKLFSEKEREVLAYKRQMTETEERLKQIQKQFQEEREVQLEHLHLSAQEIDAKRKTEQKKWNDIAEKVREFRESAEAAQNKLAEEQERIAKLKKAVAYQEQQWKDKFVTKEEDLHRLREQMIQKEQFLLTEQAKKEEERHLLQEQLSALQQTLVDERQYLGKTAEKKDSDIAKLQHALQNTIIQLNQMRVRGDQAEEKILDLQKQLQTHETDKQTTLQAMEQERIEWKKTWQEEQSRWENYKQECVLREQTLQKETEEQTKRILQSAGIVEQQLAEEQRLRQEAQASSQLKDQELQLLSKQKEDLVAHWQHILSLEQAEWQKQREEILDQLEHTKAIRDNELARLRQELQTLAAAIAEEKKFSLLEKEHGQELLVTMKRLEEENRFFRETMEAKEKEWQTILLREQELQRTQIEELSFNSAAQLHSREAEITRLNEDLKISNGQLADIRQRFAMEKNENSHRLEHIQELEIQLKGLSEQHEKDRSEWQKNIQNAQDVWKKQHQNLVLYQNGLEQQYQRDIELYNLKNKEQADRLSQLQQSMEMEIEKNRLAESERTALALQLQGIRQDHDQKISELQKKTAETLAAAERNLNEHLRKEQGVRLENEKEAHSLRQELDRLRQQLNREMSTRQSLEQKNTQLTERLKETDHQLHTIHDEMNNDKMQLSDAAEKRLAALEQKYQLRIDTLKEENDLLRAEAEQQISALRASLAELNAALNDEHKRTDLKAVEYNQQEDWRAKYSELKKLVDENKEWINGYQQELKQQYQEEINQLQKRITLLQYWRDQDHQELEKSNESLQKLEEERLALSNKLRAEQTHYEHELQQLKHQLAAQQADIRKRPQ